MKQVYRAKDISQLTGRDIFFDANVVMYIYFSSSSMKKWPATYSAIFRQLLVNKNRLIVDYNVLSEVVNRELRMNHSNFEAANGPTKYKLWRNSKDGQNAETRTYAIIKSLLSSTFQLDGKVYNMSDINQMLIPSNQDFIDKAIVNLCKEKNYILLTNDKDFSGADLEILSANHCLV